LIKRKNERYQFDFGVDEFVNERDEDIIPNELADKYPILYDIFKPYTKNTIHLNRNPSEEVQLAAVQEIGSAIKYIKNPSEAVQLAAVQKDGFAIYHITNPSEAVQLAAVRQNGRVIDYIKNPSEAVQLAAKKNRKSHN
jgi:hypothetical protein